jgi:hypothetical protein
MSRTKLVYSPSRHLLANTCDEGGDQSDDSGSSVRCGRERPTPL